MAKVLIVDDKVSNLLALEKILRRLDVQIFKALTGEEALRATLQQSFALAILDVQMPVMDGYELAGLLRSDQGTRHLPIIFLSAVYSDDPNVFRGYAAGAVEFITKPFNPDILLSKVRVFLALDEQKTELLDQKARLEALVAQLDEQIGARRQAEDCLRRTNENLEQAVCARTADMAKMVEALRLANEQLGARADQLRALAGELTMAEHRERERVSKVLHDGLQQHLAVSKLQLGCLAGRLDRDDLKQAAGEIERILAEAIGMSRSLSADLSPPVLHEGGLAAGLEWLARWMRQKHAFSVDLAVEGKPELAEDVKILVFESVRELLFNAVKHAKVSWAQIRLQQLERTGLRITVSDAGAGFDAGRLLPAGDCGAGFGLFSIRERIALIGGDFEIDSAPGKGSRFILTVPRSRLSTEPLGDTAPAAETVACDAEAILADEEPAIGVLIADDHTLFRDGLARLLNREPGIKVVGQARNGREAAELARKLRPDVILMDVSMPEVNGLEATRAILRESPAIRIIGLSMHTEAEGAQGMRAAGAVDYKNKACPASELVTAIRACVQGKIF